MKKINNKGFTLIELLATIVILSLITTVTVVSVTGAFQKGKEKSEEAFVSQTKKYIEDYISLYSSELNFNTFKGNYNKCYIGYNGSKKCNEVEVYMAKYKDIEADNIDAEADNIDIEDVAKKIADDEFINPRTNIECTNTNTNTDYFKIYRDSDYVYCYEIKNKCFPEVINTCESLYSNWN